MVKIEHYDRLKVIYIISESSHKDVLGNEKVDKYAASTGLVSNKNTTRPYSSTLNDLKPINILQLTIALGTHFH